MVISPLGKNRMDDSSIGRSAGTALFYIPRISKHNGVQLSKAGMELMCLVLESMRDKRWGRMAFGVIALIFGLAFLLVPGFTLTLFLFLFGIFMIFAGLVLIGFSRSRAPGSGRRTLNVVEGIIDIAIGVIAIFAPGFTSLLAIYLVGAFLIIAGIFQLFEGIVAPRGTATFGASNRWVLVIIGLVSLIIGITIVIFPGSGILAILWLIGIFLVIIGIANIISGLRMGSAGAPTTTAR
jgi:uncharacterized membrane protein HdeD (DUF308 family)